MLEVVSEALVVNDLAAGQPCDYAGEARSHALKESLSGVRWQRAR